MADKVYTAEELDVILTPKKSSRGEDSHMTTIKQITKDLIGPMNYKTDTKVLTEQVYKKFGLELTRINGVDLLYGSQATPKLMSVIRRIQMQKKHIEAGVKRAEAKAYLAEEKRKINA